MARFTLDGLDSEYEAKFELAVARGDILGFSFPSARDRRLDRRYYCLHGEEWRVKILELLWVEGPNSHLDHFTAEELHRIDGVLLGYSETDIGAFLRNWRNHSKDRG